VTHGDQSDIYQFLLSLQLIDEHLLKQALDQAELKQSSLCDELVSLEALPAPTLGKIMADYYEVPFVELKRHVIAPEVISLLPRHVAEHHYAVVFKHDEAGIHLAVREPTQRELATFLSKKTGLPVTLYLACTEDIEQALTLYQDTLTESLSKLLTPPSPHQGTDDTSTPVIAIVNELIEKAYISHASDIHIEPTKEFARVRFRIDGLMHEMVTLPIAIYHQVATRLKVMAQLRTDEQQAAQDGRITATLENEEIELRISFVPIAEGENIVMRLLTDAQRQFSLPGLGLSDFQAPKKFDG
jgi:type IV pilus assembly protein PilB